MDHMTLSYDFAIEFVAIINNDFFNSLSKKHQEIIIKAARKVETDLRNEVYSGEAQIVEELRSKMTVVELSGTERAAWKKATASVVDRFIKENGNAGLAAVEAARNP
jgi:C4-dicarboxylate-binding protein DctP